MVFNATSYLVSRVLLFVRTSAGISCPEHEGWRLQGGISKISVLRRKECKQADRGNVRLKYGKFGNGPLFNFPRLSPL